MGVGVGEGDLEGDGVGVAGRGVADGPVLAVGVAVGEPVEPGLRAADGAGSRFPDGGWMLIPLVLKSYRLRWRE